MSLFCLKSFDYTQDMREEDILFEPHIESPSSSPITVNTKLDVILGVIPLQLGAAAYVMTTTGVVTPATSTTPNTVDVTSTVVGSQICYCLVGKVDAKDL